jgi:secondary thiamine-phosphate synthase enzyme
MEQALHELVYHTDGQGFLEITADVADWVAMQGIRDGLLTVFIRHTSASLVIQENCDPDVQHDMLTWFRGAVPEDTRQYRHTAEGPDDQPAHIRSALTQTSLSIPVRGGRLLLGRYQGIFCFEHRRRGRERSVALHLLGV